MSSQARYVSGDTKPRVFKASKTYPFEKGDLLFRYPGDSVVRPASAMIAQWDAAHAQLAFAQYFVGIAGAKNYLNTDEKSYKPNDNYEAEVLVFTGGVWEFDCPAQAWIANQGVGVYGNSSGLCPDSQKVDSLQSGGGLSGGLSQRIGVAAPSAGTLRATTINRVPVEIQPADQRGGIPAAGTYTGTSYV